MPVGDPNISAESNRVQVACERRGGEETFRGEITCCRHTGLIPAAVGQVLVREIEAQSQEASAMQRLSQCGTTCDLLALRFGKWQLANGNGRGALLFSCNVLRGGGVLRCELASVRVATTVEE